MNLSIIRDLLYTLCLIAMFTYSYIQDLSYTQHLDRLEARVENHQELLTYLTTHQDVQTKQIEELEVALDKMFNELDGLVFMLGKKKFQTVTEEEIEE